MGERAGRILSGGEGQAVKVQTTVSQYHGWVISSLVHTLGKSEAEVARAIINEWMVANRDSLLRDLGLWPPEVKAGRAVVIPPGA